MVAALETVNERTQKLELYWHDGIEATDRFIFEGLTYNVQSTAEIGRREGVSVIGRTRVDGLDIEGR